MDDREAIEQTLGGSVEAFGHLVTRYQSAVYAVALARVCDHQDAQDLGQEAFLRAYTRLPMLKNPDAFAPWLLTILRRLSTDFLRGKWRRQRTLSRAQQEGRLCDATEDPRQEMFAADAAEALWARVSRLDDSTREILSLHYGQELKVSQIAALTALNESTVKMRLTKARAALGDRLGDLKGLWGSAPMPGLAAGTMNAVAAAGPLKAGIAGSSAVGGLFAAVAAFLWSRIRDINRWEEHAPYAMVREGKRIMLRAILLFLVALLLAPFVAFFLSGAVLEYPRPLVSALGVGYGIAITALLVAVFKREVELLSTRERAKQLVSAVGLILMLAAFHFFPSFKLGIFGAFLAAQFFFVNKSNIALGSVLPGFWVKPLLKRASSATPAEAAPVERAQIRQWLVMLHEWGLVAPPVTQDGESITVRLRLRQYMLEKMARGRSSSSLRVNVRGEVACTVVPRDYVSLVHHFGPEELPGREELAVRLGAVFAGGFAVFAHGGSGEAVAKRIGLDQCPVNPNKTQVFAFLQYALPLLGVALLVTSAVRHLLWN